jgi:hypothetical protein
MSRFHAHADDERDALLQPPERSFSVSPQVNSNNANGYTDLNRRAFIMNSESATFLTGYDSMVYG